MTTSASRGVAYRTRRARSYLVDLWGRREFAWYLAMGNLKARNASTALGLFWWVLNPLLLGLVYLLVFGVIFGDRRPPDYVAHILSGMFVFHFTHQSMTGGANSILQNSRLLVNLRFPRMVLPISALLESSVGFLTSLGVFYAIAWPVVGTAPSGSLALLLVAVPIHLIFNIGLAAAVARLAVPFRDITNFLPYLTRLWLYMSPVIWPLSFLDSAGPNLRGVIEANPMFHLIAVYRAALMGSPLDSYSLVYAAVAGLLVFVLGVASFVLYESRIVRYL